MEAVEAFLDGEWESLSKLFSCEDSDLLLHCNTNNLFSYSENYNVGEIDASNLLLPSNNLLDHTSFYSGVSQESSHISSNENTNNNNIESSSLFAPIAAHDVSFTTNSFDQSMFPDDLMEEILQLKAQILCNDDQFQGAGVIRPRESDDSCKEEMQLKRKYEASNNALQPSQDHNTSSQSSKKRRRVAREAQASKSNAETKKAKRAAKTSTNDDEEMNINGGSTCSSEGDDCNASEESESKGSTSAKAKASKSPATDPQSLYARKRRERINERLRVLQNLVPNGTKVDISTMLEEAVQYVKFLQLQIKLLSCDDMWMYAPIAYNGMDIGLYQRIVPNMRPPQD